jgi:hypothetical protein
MEENETDQHARVKRKLHVVAIRGNSDLTGVEAIVLR